MKQEQRKSTAASLFLLAVSMVTLCACTQAQPEAILSAAPDSASQGQATVEVSFTLAGETPPTPPEEVPASAARIGGVSGSNVQRSGFTVTAVFDITAGEPAGVKTVEIDFPGPSEQGIETVTLTGTNLFTVLAAEGEGESEGEEEGEDEGEGPLPPAGLPYPVVDTGQDACSNASTTAVCPAAGVPFHGQDAQHTGYQPSYTLSADGLTVHDNVTGLTWTRSPDWDGDGAIDSNDKFLFDAFLAYPDTLNAAVFGGYNDWRTPTIKELYSLIDFRGTDPPVEGGDTSGLTPFIDTDYFEFGYGDTAAGERLIDAQFWSNTEYVSTTMGGLATTFGVNFADGRIKGYGRTDPMGNERMDQYALFVRGNPDYGINDFADNGDGTVTDYATGLMWEQADNGYGVNWENALAHAGSAATGGYDDWRLPSAKELQSLVDYTRSPDTTDSPAIDPLFSCTPMTNEAGQADYGFYWSSTTHLSIMGGTATRAAYVAFGRGMGQMNDITMDVHGAGCQRSDPKDGDPDDYPVLGMGPQGDAQRVFNYVRLVRDVELPGEGEGEGIAWEGEPDPEAAHSADWNGGSDFQIDLTELLRVVQLYNALGYHCAGVGDSTDEGYVPGFDGSAQGCAHHAADYNPTDWTIGLSELLRVIQFYNAGSLHPCPAEGTEDGFCLF